VITIGVDPHKSTLTAVGLAPEGRALDSVRLAVHGVTLEELLVFARGWPDRQWAVEGAAGLGLGIAQRLLVYGEDVVDVAGCLVVGVDEQGVAPRRPRPQVRHRGHRADRRP